MKHKMKKLMVALVAIAFTAVAQAAAFNWTSSGTNAAKTFYGADGNTIAGAIVYLIDTATIAQGDLVTAMRGGAAITDYASVKTSTLDANSRLTATPFTYGAAEQTYNFYMAIVQDDYVFVSDFKTVTGQASDTVPVQFSGIKTATSNNFGAADYSSAGWYETAAVPEPTSGLLMLLGMAGLALRRRRA